MAVIAERFQEDGSTFPGTDRSQAMHAGLGVLKPLLTESETESTEFPHRHREGRPAASARTSWP